MHNPTNVQEVQKLNGRLASLSRFFPKLAEKVKLLYKLLKKTEPFLWDETCEQAFLAFKKTISPITCEQAFLALVQVEGKHQLLIHFTSHILDDIEKCYQMIEKVALALITSTRHLRPYFQSHKVVVKMNFPIKQVLRKPHKDTIHGIFSSIIC